MFHRVRTEPAQPQAQPSQPQVQPQAQTQTQPAARPQSAPQQPTPAAQDSAPRFEEFKQQQNLATEQDRTPAQPISAPINTQSHIHSSKQPSHQEDVSVMNTTPTPATNTQANTEEYAAGRNIDMPASPYQRPGQAPVRAGAGYPGAYPAAAYPGRTATPTTPATTPSMSAGDSRLIIGRGISISGEIEACDHLIVEGTVEAALKGASNLEIAENGTFYGTVDIQEATVAGRFEGDITVHGRLTVRATGVITGSINYKELEIEAGAIVDARLTPAGAQNDARKASSKGKKQASSNDGGLFNTKAAAE
jgi:cytoskeletal protein CcmA (bactofilin family)